MISTAMCCHWMLLCVFAILALPAIHLASAGIVRYRNPLVSRRGHRHPSTSSDSSTSHASTSHASSSLSSPSVVHNPMDQSEARENNTPPTWSSLLEDSVIEFPAGFKFVGLDENNAPFIIIPNVQHLLESDTDLVDMLKTAMHEAHRSKRSPSSSRQCNFDYQVTVSRTGRCTRFGNIPACQSGDQLYPFARGC